MTDLGKRDVFLGHEWLQWYNLSIDWQSSKLYLDKCRHWCRRVSIKEEPEDIGKKTNEIEKGGRILFVNMEEKVLRQNEIEIRRVEEGSGEAKFENVVLEEYWEFKEEVFDKKAFDKLPSRRPWDHTIELIPGATLKDYKVYPLSVKEQKELDCFLDKHLKTGHIRLLKSPCAVPFFFVKKKDGLLRPVQDYRWLNEVIIKNKYPLLLIQELIDKVSYDGK